MHIRLVLEEDRDKDLIAIIEAERKRLVSMLGSASTAMAVRSLLIGTKRGKVVPMRSKLCPECGVDVDAYGHHPDCNA